MKRFKLIIGNFWETFKDYPAQLLLTIVMTILIIFYIVWIVLFPIVELLIALYWIFRWIFYVNWRIRFTKDLRVIRNYAVYDYKVNSKYRNFGLLLTNIWNHKLAIKRLKKEGKTYGED